MQNERPFCVSLSGFPRMCDTSVGRLQESAQSVEFPVCLHTHTHTHSHIFPLSSTPSPLQLQMNHVAEMLSQCSLENMSAIKHKTRPSSSLHTHTQRSKVKLTLLFKPGGTPAGSEGGQVLNYPKRI